MTQEMSSLPANYQLNCSIVPPLAPTTISLDKLYGLYQVWHKEHLDNVSNFERIYSHTYSRSLFDCLIACFSITESLSSIPGRASSDTESIGR
jgi:hypothetical protein